MAKEGVDLLAKVSRAIQRGTLNSGLIVERRGVAVELSMPFAYDVRAELVLADEVLAWATAQFGEGTYRERSGVMKRRNPVHAARPRQLAFIVRTATFHAGDQLAGGGALHVQHLIAHEHCADQVRAFVMRGGALTFHCWACQRPITLAQARALGVKV